MNKESYIMGKILFRQHTTLLCIHKSFVIHPITGVDMIGSFAELSILVIHFLKISFFVLDQL